MLPALGGGMDSFVVMWKDGGPMMYPLLLLVLVGLFVQVLIPGIGLARLRVPGVLSAALPMLLVLTGLLGSYMGFNMAWEAVAKASAEMRSVLLVAGTSIATYTLTFAMGGAAILFTIASGSNAMATLVDGLQSRETGSFRPIGVVVCGLSLVVVPVLAYLGGPFWALCSLPALLALAIVSLRADTDEGVAARLGAGKLRTTAFAMGAALTWMFADAILSRAQQLMAGASASAEMRETLIAMHGGELFNAYVAGAIWLVVLAVLGLVISGPQLRYLGSPRSAVGGLLLGGCLVAIAVVGVGFDVYVAGVFSDLMQFVE